MLKSNISFVNPYTAVIGELLKANMFYDMYSYDFDSDIIHVIGKKGRFVENKYTVYIIGIKDNKISSETVIKSFSKLPDAKEMLQ